jgi:hypothetical protein
VGQQYFYVLKLRLLFDGKKERIPDSLYGVEVRCPGDGTQLTEEDMHEAYQAALKIKEFIKLKVN